MILIIYFYNDDFDYYCIMMIDDDAGMYCIAGWIRRHEYDSWPTS